MTAQLDQLIDDDLVSNASDRPIGDLRAARDAGQAFEVGLSFIRRIVQGRLDIVGAEVERRRVGGRPLDAAALVATLPDLLADQTSGSSARALGISPPDIDRELLDQLDAIVGAGELTELGSMSSSSLASVADRLAQLERAISDHRRRLHGYIDTLQHEIIARYRSGDEIVDTLLEQA